MQYMHITGPTYRPPHNACPDYRKNARPLLIVKSEFPGYNGRNCMFRLNYCLNKTLFFKMYWPKEAISAKKSVLAKSPKMETTEPPKPKQNVGQNFSPKPN